MGRTSDTAFAEFLVTVGDAVWYTPWYIWVAFFMVGLFFGVPQVLWNMLLSWKKEVRSYADSFKSATPDGGGKKVKEPKIKKFQLCDAKGTPIPCELFRQPSADTN